MEDNLFDLINNLYHKRFRYPTDQELAGKLWIINRFVSMDNDLLDAVSYISKYFFTLKEQYYRFLYRLIPMSSSQRNKLLRPPKEENPELLKRYSQYLGVSTREVRDCLKVLRANYGDKEIFEFVGLELNKKNGLHSS